MKIAPLLRWEATPRRVDDGNMIHHGVGHQRPGDDVRLNEKRLTTGKEILFSREVLPPVPASFFFGVFLATSRALLLPTLCVSKSCERKEEVADGQREAVTLSYILCVGGSSSESKEVFELPKAPLGFHRKRCRPQNQELWVCSQTDSLSVRTRRRGVTVSIIN